MATRQKATSPPAEPSPLDQATAYALAVVEGGADARELAEAWPHLRLDARGRVLTNRHVRDACARHLRDQSRADLVWDAAAAERGITFFRDVLPLEDGRPFVLSPHQAFIFGSLYGWKAPGGELRFRIAYVEVAKGDGKSPSGAGFILRGGTAEGQQAAECYVAAAKKDQAMIAFRDCARMARQSPALARRLKPSGTFPHTWNLAHMESGSFMRPISSEDAQSGPRIFRALIDELHEHRSSNVLDMMVAGTKGRRNSLIFIITNSGYDRTSVCWREHEYSVKVLRGELEDDSRFVFIAGLDPCAKHAEEGQEFPVEGCTDCDDWREERVWPKANPNVGVTITVDYLRKQVRLAMGMPEMENVVKRLNFCIWTEQGDRAIPIEVWDRNSKLVTLNQLAGEECYGGLDLGATDDLCALSLIFPRGDAQEMVDGDGAVVPGEPWPLLPWFWMPEEAFHRRRAEGRYPWQMWRDEGLVTVTMGAITNYAFIRQQVGEIAETVDLRGLAVDRWGAMHLINQLLEDGLPALLYGQGFRDLSDPTKLFMAMLRAGRFAHGGHKVLRWQSTNLALETDAAGNVKPHKGWSGGKIDGLAAAINAMGCAMSRKERAPSIYEQHAASEWGQTAGAPGAETEPAAPLPPTRRVSIYDQHSAEEWKR